MHLRGKPAPTMLFIALWALASAAHAHHADLVDADLDPVVVTARGVSEMTGASTGDVSQQDLAALPTLRPAAILETVPGLIVTQHSGEGKANQYFMRAFNLDHGTDLAPVVDGMPVNLVSHAHGQGYADLNFLIPETVGDLHYRKGPYYTDSGDFSAAGSIRIALDDHPTPVLEAGLGPMGYRRALGLGTVELKSFSVTGAIEGYHNDGPFEVPDNYRRNNALLRLVSDRDGDRSTVALMHYDGRWNSTDQIAEHLIDNGIVGRYGSVAPTDGGESHRDSLSFSHRARQDNHEWDLSGYVFNYGLDLYSTFTDHLSDARLGDQIHQHDQRTVFGFKVSDRFGHSLLGRASSTLLGIETRYDDIQDVGIDHTNERRLLFHQQDARVGEGALAVYAENTTTLNPTTQITVGLRSDTIDFQVTDGLTRADGFCNLSTDPLGCNTGHRRASLLSPKFGIAFGPFGPVRAFLNIADGFHSNDARGVTRSGENPLVASATPLVRAHSAEAGVVAQIGHAHTTIDVYQLKLASELVFSGDAGDTSPSGSTTRRGVELSERYTLNDRWSADLNGAYSRGHFDHNTEPNDLGCGSADMTHPCTGVITVAGREIPNSPTAIFDGGLTYKAQTTTVGLRFRHFGRAPLVEDGSAWSAPYTTLDLRLGWQDQHWRFGLDVFNLTNARWNDITYYYVSRHPGETHPSADYVIHPGVPRTWRFSGGLRF